MRPSTSSYRFGGRGRSKKSSKHKPSGNRLVSVLDWLSGRYLLRSLEENVIEECYDEIIESLGKKDIISILIKASTSDQIKGIVKILKDAQLKEIEKNKDKLMTNYYKNNTHKSYFDYLSEESIFNICEFLDKTDVKRFKMTSTFISLIALELMGRHKVSVFNMNELIQQKQYKFQLRFDVKNKVKINRIKAFNKNKSLMNIYSKRYEILPENLLILKSCYGNNAMYIKFWNENDSQIIRDTVSFNQQQIERLSVFYVFDKAKILTLNNTKKLVMMSQIHKAEQMKNYGLVLLQYYNANNRYIQNVEYLWLDATTKRSRIKDYILNDLYGIFTNLYNNASTNWCTDLLYKLDKMKQFGSNLDEKLIHIYLRQENHFDTKYIEYVPNNENFSVSPFKIITFEINYGHPFFKAQQKKIQYESSDFYPYIDNIGDFMRDQRAKYIIRVEYVSDENMLRNHVKYFDDSLDISKIKKCVKLCITPTTTFALMRNQIASRLNYAVPIENIQIYKYPVNGVYEKCHQYGIQLMDSLIGNAAGYVRGLYQWEIVPYKEVKIKNMYKVAVYEQEMDAEHGNIFRFPRDPVVEINFNNDDSDNDDEAKQEEKVGFIVNEYMMKVIDTMSHEMNGNGYKAIIDKYNDKDNYSFVIMDKNYINDKKYKCYQNNQQFEPQCNKDNNFYDVNVLIIRNVIENDKKEMNVIITFCNGDDGFISDKDWYNMSIGFPIKVWIGKTSTIRSIMQKYFGDYYENKFIFDSCVSKYDDITLDESIYDKMSDKQDNELLITLKMVQQKMGSSNTNMVGWSFNNQSVQTNTSFTSFSAF